MPAADPPPLPLLLPVHVRRLWFALCDRLRDPVRIVEERPGVRAVEVLGVLRYLILPTARRVHYSCAVGKGRFVAAPMQTVVTLNPPLAVDHWLSLFAANWLVDRGGARVPPDRFADFHLSIESSAAFGELLDRVRACRVVEPLREAIVKGLALDQDVLAFMRAGGHRKPSLDSKAYSESWTRLVGYRVLQREAPQLTRLFAFAAKGRHVPAHEEPARALKAAVRGAGLGNAGWRELLRTEEDVFDAVLAHARGADPFLACLWAVEARLRARHPLSPEVLSRLASPHGVYDLDRPALVPSSLRAAFWPALLPALGKRLASVGSGSALEQFLDGEFEDVMLMLRAEGPALDANQARAGWPHLLRRQQEWAERERQAAIAEAEPFPTGKHPRRAWAGDLQIITLADSFALWEEGWHMGHCIHDYRKGCLAGDFLAFSIRDAAGKRLATGAMTRDAKRPWKLCDVRGRLNRLVSAELNSAAEWFVEFVRAHEASDGEARTVQAAGESPERGVAPSDAGARRGPSCGYVYLMSPRAAPRRVFR